MEKSTQVHLAWFVFISELLLAKCPGIEETRPFHDSSNHCFIHFDVNQAFAGEHVYASIFRSVFFPYF